MGKKGKFKKVLLLILAAGLAYAGILHLNIRKAANETPEPDAEFIIILGARVKGEVPSLALQARIDTAADYLVENKAAVAIASGGKGPGEDISEAAAIKKALIVLGIEESRIILEDKSTTTYENIKFSQKAVPDGLEKGLVVTNDFHIYRAKMIAADAGLDLGGLPAPTPWQAVVKSYLREYLALTKYFMTKAF